MTQAMRWPVPMKVGIRHRTGMSSVLQFYFKSVIGKICKLKYKCEQYILPTNYQNFSLFKSEHGFKLTVRR